jgi:hypothetical protein
MCRKVLFGLYLGKFNAGHEQGTGCPMAFRMNRRATSARRILSQAARSDEQILTMF